jgi:hypothetical protein
MFVVKVSVSGSDNMLSCLESRELRIRYGSAARRDASTSSIHRSSVFTLLVEGSVLITTDEGAAYVLIVGSDAVTGGSMWTLPTRENKLTGMTSRHRIINRLPSIDCVILHVGHVYGRYADASFLSVHFNTQCRSLATLKTLQLVAVSTVQRHVGKYRQRQENLVYVMKQLHVRLLSGYDSNVHRTSRSR